ncbi:MAG: ribonuclease HII [Thermoplasmatales archaeon]|jgi:ribonuclease HII|nr:ribonuclease HII [Candidatus Thermoplasmatota archaeon]MCL6003196.1 ribonuclease HII [Candidatus Thermoplasmatota archaeon]MDA8054938.1 ribonuclease HII [Thermoplasmatales archaeon]
MLCGCDEAGRGPVIGPMVIAVVCGDSESIRRIGVKDSKKLSESTRELMFDQIERIASSVEFVIIDENEIDNATFKNQLNVLEARAMAKLIKPENEYIIDCPDVNEERFSGLITELSGNKKIISKHKADVDYPLVSAASIIAKVTREREVSKIKEELGEFGSGYPSDERTITFLKDYFKRYRKLPPHVRRSWKTVNNITSTLEDY